MIAYRPRSWSEQARTYANAMYESGVWMIENGEWTEEQRKKEQLINLQSSYRNKLVIYRAAKRLHRKECL